MAILVAVAGAAIGSATGIGASLGWTIGSVLGQLLFPNKGANTTTEGPRLGDLSVSSSAYGTSISIGYGTVRTSGNIIWSSGIRETRHKKTQKSGGKGGGGAKATSITYTYSADFALALGEGPADDVLRIWADGKVIFDKRATSTTVRKKGLKFTFYKGTEEQLPDPIIVADKGADATPAFRGITYIVFDDLQLADFGNRIPNITVELTYSATVNRLVIGADPWTVAEGGTATNALSSIFLVDWARKFAYVRTTSPQRGFRRINLQTMKEDRQILESQMFPPGSPMVLSFTYGSGIGPDGGIVNVTDNTSHIGGNTLPISRFDPNTYQETHRFGFNSVSAPTATPRNVGAVVRWAWCQCYTLNGIRSFLIAGSSFSHVTVLDYPNIDSYLWDTRTFAPMIAGPAFQSLFVTAMVGLPAIDEKARAYIFSRHETNDTFHIHELQIAHNAAYIPIPRPGGADEGDYGEDLQGIVNDMSAGVQCRLLQTIPYDDIWPGATSMTNGGHMVYDQIDDTFICLVEMNNNGGWWWFKTDGNSIIWKTQVNHPGFASNGDFIIGNFFSSQSIVNGGVLGYVVNNRPWLLNTMTGQLIESGEAPAYPVPSNTGSGMLQGVFDGDTETFLGANNDSLLARWFFRRGGGLGANVADIVEDICGRVGLTQTDLDLSDLADDTIPGYIIGTRTSARAAIEPLATSYFFDGVESDFILKFPQRGQDPVREIIERELGTLDARSNEPLKEARQQEVELPERLTVLYMDQVNDYQQGTQSSKRLQNPVPSMWSRNQITASFPAVFDTTFAKQLSEKLLYSSWVERSSYETITAWTHMDLDPTDVVTIRMDDGTVYYTRLSQVEIGDNFQLSMMGVSERPAQYVSSAIGDAGAGPIHRPILNSDMTKLLLLDVPLLRDGDEPPGRTVAPLYHFMGAYTENWVSGLLMKSADGTSFAQVGQNASPMTWGQIVGALGDPPDNNPFCTDYVNTLTIAFFTENDAITSVTELEVLNGANAAAIIKPNGEVEVIQWRDAEQLPNGTWRLSTLLRGRRGTDTMAFGHTPGEIFLLLDADDGDVHALGLSEVNQVRYFKGVGVGDFLEDAELNQITSQGRSLKPYAPVHMTATLGISNVINLAWVRRTRVSGELLDGIPTVPLNEDTEEYEVEILDAPNGSVVRTVTGLTSPAYAYSSSDQTTDGFSPPLSSITIRVYQVSAQVGRGFTKEVTIDVN